MPSVQLHAPCGVNNEAHAIAKFGLSIEFQLQDVASCIKRLVMDDVHALM